MRNLLGAAFACMVFTVPARAVDVDKYLPEDTEAVLTINVRQILDAPFIKKDAFADLHKALEDRGGNLKHLKDLDLDPQKDLDSIVVTNSNGDPDRSLLIVHGRFEVTRFEAKAAEIAKAQPEQWSVTTIPDGTGGQYKVLKSSKWYDFSGVKPTLKNKPAYIALLDKRVLVASPSKDLVIDALDKAKGRKKPALKSKELGGLLEKANGKQSLWIAVLPSALGKILPLDDDSSIRDELQKIDAISGGFTIDDEVKLEIALAVKDGDTARELTTEINEGLNIALTLVALASHEKKELEPALDALKSLRATAKGNTIILKGAVTMEMIEKSLKKKGK
jgi:hypothetical protein